MVVRGITSQVTSRLSRTHVVYQDPKEASVAVEIRQFFAGENFVIGKLEVILSPDDQRALELVKIGTKRLEVGYKIALPWKEGEPKSVFSRSAY